MAPSLEDLAPTAPAVSIDVPKSFNYGPSVLQPALQFNDEPVKNGYHSTITEGNGSNGTNLQIPPPPSLDALEKFTGTFRGFGFNTIFRPSSRRTETKFDKPPTGPDDNVLQLNLTGETQAFGDILKKVPNRGLFDQADIDLTGFLYTQTIVDAMPPREGEPVSHEPPGIHFEPGLWMRVPEVAQMPKLSASFCRMGSIPHGTTINAQGFQPAITNKGAPDIPGIDITPILLPLGNGPQEIEIQKAKIRFKSQDAHNDTTRRLPQDLDFFVKNGTITQAILDDPNKILRDANEGKDIVDNTMFIVSTNAPADAFGGGTTNIGFNIGADSGLKREPLHSGNANAVDVMAQYWVSTIRTQVELDPSMKIGQTVSPAARDPRDAVPEFFLDKDITIPSTRKTVTVAYTQIQYSQMVFLDFNGIKWPHVTVATLAPIVHLEKPTLSSAIKAAQFLTEHSHARQIPQGTYRHVTCGLREMADPLSIIGTAGAIANIVDVLTKTITTVCDMRQAWKIADLTVLTFENQLNLLKVALGQIQKWATSSKERGREIDMQVDSCVTCCRLLIGKIDSEMSQFERTIAGNLNTASKFSLFFKSNDMEQIQRMVDQQTQALTLLLSACTANAIEDQIKVLHQPKVIQAFQQMDQDTASLIAHRDSASIMTATSVNSSKWSIQFAFDRDLFITRVYDKWIRKIATNRKEERTRYRGSVHQSKRYTPDVELSATRLPSISINDHATTCDDSSQSSAKVSEQISNSLTPTRNIGDLEPQSKKYQGASRDNESSHKGSRVDVKVAVLGSKTRKRVVEEMKRVNGDQCYTEEQLSLFRPMILEFTLESAKSLADNLLYSLPMVELNLVRHSLEYILAYGDNSKHETVLSPQLAVAVGEIMNHPSTKSWKDIANLCLPDNGEYFLREIDRIASETFVPREIDVVEFSALSPGCIESTLRLGSFDLQMVDPGSIIPSRKVLFTQLENMHAVVFVLDLGSYAEFLPDGSNSMFETMLQFEALVVSQFLRNSSIIVLLTNFNKLEKSLSKVPLRRCFADFTGANDALKAADFIMSKINHLNTALLPIYPHLVSDVFRPEILPWIHRDIQDILVSMSLKKLGLGIR
ncbi:hypothetical protein FGRMN_6234 [Fusarium graminum]|nr:hypothetical protein FGRMN_6234 [Fusarium graminum]